MINLLLKQKVTLILFYTGLFILKTIPFLKGSELHTIHEKTKLLLIHRKNDSLESTLLAFMYAVISIIPFSADSLVSFSLVATNLCVQVLFSCEDQGYMRRQSLQRVPNPI